MNFVTPYIPVYCNNTNNFGDAVNLYLIKRISLRNPVIVSENDKSEKVMVCGSILNHDVSDCIVWGSGLDCVQKNIPSKKMILAVRGKLTGQELLKNGIQYNNVYGDPALLLPRVFNPKIDKRYKLGFIPSSKDDIRIIYDKLKITDYELLEKGIKVIDIMAGVEDVICNIKSCDKILSGSLYGLMMSHTYGVPAEWTKFSDNNNDFKFLDYFTSVGIDKNNFMDLRSCLNFETINALIGYNGFTLPIMTNVDLNSLWNCCPFRRI